MVLKRMTLADPRTAAPEVDLAKLEATTEADIARQAAADGEPPAGSGGGRVVLPAGAVRTRLGLSQPAFAELIGVPVGTVRNWEQGRVRPDPAARALLVILAKEPKAAMRALKTEADR